ncbi:hypothetical protein FW774_15115 [Pedobacter sp. BS3]|uniref:metallophosphoesterase n=1 Tax=Pedobacter sp. BS3 TaxID=2567937 RepID=UPI0011EDDEB8|nr:metallophosphoesterase [Pedobacter sp. BS3]TZF82816.1 hypothetical protein FW774_15115 [Pedobacter sp. BS3]
MSLLILKKTLSLVEGFREKLMNFNKSVMLGKWTVTVCLLLISFGCKTKSYTTTSTYGVSPGDEYFSIAVLPDTQYYTATKHGGTMEMFEQQIQWIRDNRKAQNIAYVIHLGDISDHGEAKPQEWVNASSVLYKLEKDNIPYGLAVGNHDETPNSKPANGSPNTSYTKYFGKSHFKDKPWYGGAMGNNDNSDNHFDLFSANGDNYIAVYFAYNDPAKKDTYNATYEKQVMHWADSILTVYDSRKAILVTHGLLKRPKGSTSNIKPGEGDNSVPSEFTAQGKVIYNMAKYHNNVFLMLGGHISGEGFRRDDYNGHVIKSYLTDYQSRQNPPYSGEKDRNGGNGTMRLMKINKTKQTLSVTTFIPRANGMVIKEEDGDSQFTEPLFK